MTALTIKRPVGDTLEETKMINTFYNMFPAFYMHSIDEITLTSAIVNKKYEKHICDIIDHEYQHAVIAELEGKETSKKLDNILRDMLDWM